MRGAEADIAVMDESRWSRVSDLFDRLLDGADPDTTLEREPDLLVRETAMSLWHHHQRADAEDYLGAPMGFEVATVFQPGQVLLNRFRIEEMLGSGGMGEVYLAWDERMEDRVALKTISRLLAPSDSIRRRFIAEVQSARHVTHPNVCRIHELFEEGENVFFSMEYVKGVLLSDFISNRQDTKHAGLIARQMAEALHAAHKTGVVHGDFKPANVMIVDGPGRDPRAVIMDFGLARALDRAAGSSEEPLSVQAGTLEYMAPELQDGGTPTIRSDIFAFGKIGSELLPDARIWDECTRPSPEDRPDSLDKIIRRLQPRTRRRYWVAGLVVAAASGARFLTWPPSGPPQVSLPADARILINGFRSLTGLLPATKLARSLVLTALLQSSRIHAIADGDLVPMLKHLKLGAGVPQSPLAGRGLDDVLTELRASFWIDGDLRKVGERYSLDLRLIAATNRQVVAASAFHDEPGVIPLAQNAAIWVRKTAGESRQSMAANPSEAGSYTSAVPEALQSYYDAMEQYALSKMGSAVPLFREAIRLDPGFAQAHAMLGMTLNAADAGEAFREIDVAFRLAEKLPYRERIAIEAHYYTLTGNTSKMIQTAQQSVVDRPDEPRRHVLLGQTLGVSGRLAEAVASFRKAVDLTPDDWMPVQRLVAGLVEAGQHAEALSVFGQALERQIPEKWSDSGAGNWIYNGAGSAYIGLERYSEAIEAFANEPPHSENITDMQAAKVLQGHLEIAIAAIEGLRAGQPNARDTFRGNEFLCGLYFVTDRRASAIQHVREMAALTAYPATAEHFACAASWARRLEDGETLAAVGAKASEIARRWPNARTLAVEQHVSALQMWSRNALESVELPLLESAGAAYSVWALFDLAEFFTQRAEWEKAEEYWKQFESHRGTVIVKGWFPGILVLGWLHRAVAAQARNDRPLAFLSSKKVLDHWSRSNPHLQIVRTAESINFSTRPA
jgi:serine/threonine protein kinase/tetratricopeptide (TPR) repeat protein